MFDASTMMAMFRLIRQRQMGISLELNLLRKIIDVQFQLDISLPTEKQRIERYRFRIPLAQLSRVRTVQDERSCALIISLDNPPNFYRRMHRVEASHEEDPRYWTEWDCWFRQTDIVHDPRSLMLAPLALKKDKPIIDIGTTSFAPGTPHAISS